MDYVIKRFNIADLKDLSESLHFANLQIASLPFLPYLLLPQALDPSRAST